VRTEHMVQDWNGLESMLKGERPAEEDFGRLNPSKSKATDGDNYLSEESRVLLCEVLCEEIQLYKKLLKKAVNLSEGEIKTSYDELAESCPREAKISSCRTLR